MAFNPIAYDRNMMLFDIRSYNNEISIDPSCVPIDENDLEDFMRAMNLGATSEVFEFMILGNGELRTDTSLSANLGCLAVSPAIQTTSIQELFKNTYPQATSPLVAQYVRTIATQGAVMNTTKWHPFKNDCFIYGALFARKTFNLALENPITRENVWDFTQNRPRILGRELLMLKLSGYKSNTTNLEIIFTPPDFSSARDQTATLSDYRSRINLISHPAEILSLL